MGNKFTRPKRYKQLAQSWGYSLKDLANNLHYTHQDLADKLAQRPREWGCVGNKTDRFNIVARRDRDQGEGPFSVTYNHRGTGVKLDVFVEFIRDSKRNARYSPSKSIIDLNMVDHFLDQEIAEEDSEIAAEFKDFLKTRGSVVEKEEVLELKTEEVGTEDAETEKIEDDPLENFPTEEDVRDSGYHYLLAIAATWKDVQEELGRLRRENKSLEENADPNIGAMLDRLTEKDEEIFNLKASLKSATASLEKAREEFKKLRAKINDKQHALLSTEPRLRKTRTTIETNITQMTVKKLLWAVPELSCAYDERYPPSEVGATSIDQRIGFGLRKYAKFHGITTKWDKVTDDVTGHEVNMYPVQFLNEFTKDTLQLDILP